MNTDKVYAESIAKEYAADIMKLAKEITDVDADTIAEEEAKKVYYAKRANPPFFMIKNNFKESIDHICNLIIQLIPRSKI